jgi:DnaA family protein
MRQLLLDLGAEKAQTLDTFVVGQNQELLQLLRFYARCGSALPQDRFVYLWGEPGSGKSHLLQALGRSSRARYIAVSSEPEDYAYSPKARLYLLDDCEKLPPDSQIAAFALYNQVRENGGLLVAAGAMPPAALTLREDLRTRLGWGLIYQLHGLSDDEKIAALTHTARLRGISLSPGVLPYLITHFRRDMQSLSAMLDALDQYSLEMQRPITLPLLRSLLQIEGEPKT